MRRRAFWTLLTAFVLLFLGWLAFIPYRQDRVFEALPASASFVSVHHGLAARWPALVRNPTVTNLLVGAGIKPADVTKLATDPETLSWVNRLAGRDTVFAYVPALGFQDRPAWVGASWVGGWGSLKLRVQLLFARSTDFRPVAADSGRTVYITRTKFSDPTQRLSLALVDGVVLACVSRDPVGVRWLLETGDRYPWRPSLATSGQSAAARALLQPSLPAHWGWVALPGLAGPDPAVPGVLAYTLDVQAEHRITAHLAVAGALPGGTGRLDAARLAPVAKLLGASPDLIAVLPLASVTPLLLRSEAPLWRDPLRALLAPEGAPAGALAFVALLNPDHGGRVRGPLGSTLGALTKGLKVPTVVAGFQVASNPDADARLDRALDQLNARYGSSLARAPALAEGGVTLIEERRSGLYSKFEPDERLACTVADGWFFLFSNASILKKRLTPPEGQAQAAPAWAESATRAPASAAAWIDLKSAAKSVRDATATATLLAIATQGPDDARQGKADWRATLTTVREAAEALQVFGQGAFTAASSNGTTRMDLVLGGDR